VIENRTAYELQGFLELLLGRETEFFCGWTSGTGGGFITSQSDKETVLAWLEKTIEALQNKQLMPLEGPNG
jgi:hypothetical protein